MDCSMPGFLSFTVSCPSWVYSDSCSPSQWCHPTILPSVIPFSCLQSFPALGSFPVSQLFTWGDQSIGVSASASVLPMNTQDWSPLGWTGWISLQSKGLSRVFSNTTVQKHQCSSSVISFLYGPALTTIYDHWEGHSRDYTDFCRQHKVSAFQCTIQVCHHFPAKKQSSSDFKASHHLQWFWSPRLWSPTEPSATVSIISPSVCHDKMRLEAMVFVFWKLDFKPAFSLASFTFIKRLFSSCLLSAVRMVSSACLRLLIFLLAIMIPACASSNPAFLMMYSAYKLNKQGNNIQAWCTPSPIWN